MDLKQFFSMNNLIGIFNYRGNTLKDVFSRIYLKKSWGDKETISGPGSTLIQTVVIRNEISNIIKQFNITSMLDAPCGDFNWIQHMQLNNCNYIGIDIVPEMIKSISKKYSNQHRKFICANIVEDPLPCADLILCRDALVHLSLQQAQTALKNFKISGSSYLLATTFPECHSNKETIDAIWRPLNLQKPPFNLPKPLMIINENNTHDLAYPDKSLGLWCLKDISF